MGPLRKTFYALGQRLLFSLPTLRRRNTSGKNLLVKTDAIGDFILASGAIGIFLDHDDRAWTLLCSPAVRPLAKACFPDLEVVAVPGTNSTGPWEAVKRLMAFRRLCGQWRVHTLISLKHARSGMDHVYIQWLRPRESWACSEVPIHPDVPASFRSHRFDHTVPYPVSRGVYPLEVEAHRHLLSRVLDLEPSRMDPRPFVPRQGPTADHPIPSPGLVVFPSTRDRIRNYPPEALADVVAEFMRAHPEFTLLLCGAPGEYAMLADFRSRLGESLQGVRIEIPRDLLDACRIIEHATLVLGMDSAPAHIAVCVDTPGVFLLAGGQYDHFGPWSPTGRQIWLSHKLPCFHCNWRCIYPEPRCLTRVPPQTIRLALERAARPLSARG